MLFRSVSLWLVGAVLGFLLARQKPDLSQIVFFAAAGAATATQSLLGLYEIVTGASVPGLALTRLVQFFFPILYVMFSGFTLVELAFWLATVGLFLAGFSAQIAHQRRLLLDTAPAHDSIEGPSPASLRRLPGPE